MQKVTALLFDKRFTHALELYMTCTSLDVQLFGNLYDWHFCECVDNSLISITGMLGFPMGNKRGLARE